MKLPRLLWSALVQWHIEDDLHPVLVQHDEELVIPEPATVWLLALGAGAFVFGRACRRGRRRL